MVNFIIYLIAGLGAGLGTGLAGISAAAVISRMIITFELFSLPCAQLDNGRLFGGYDLYFGTALYL